MTNVQITAVKKELKDGQSGFEVKIDGMDNKLTLSKSFSQPLKAMRYMFWLSKKLELDIDTVQLAAVSIAYQRVKAAEAKIVECAQEAIAEYDEAEAESDDDSAVVDEPKAQEIAETPCESPMVKQFKELKAKHPDALLLFRAGDFYETYGPDAVAASEILGITLTRRSSDKSAMEMAGFPYHALDSYLPRLIRAGKRVAICDQIQDPVEQKKRGRKPKAITELITPAKDLFSKEKNETKEAV